MKIAFAKPAVPNAGSYVVGVHEDRKLTGAAAALDKRTRGMVAAALAASRFRGRKGETLEHLKPWRAYAAIRLWRRVAKKGIQT